MKGEVGRGAPETGVDSSPSRAQLREEFRKVFGTDNPFQKNYRPEELIQFAPLPAVGREEDERLRREAERLGPFFQGPFPITQNLTITGAYDGRPKCQQILGPMLPQSLAGKRVLEIAANAGFDSFFINLRGPREYVAIEPHPVFHEQALFLNSLYRARIDFRRLAWQELSPDVQGTFDLVVCIGLLYHEPSPMELLAKLNQMTALGGTVLLETLVVAEEANAPAAKFVEGSYRGDPSVWWIPTIPCVEAMLRASGFPGSRLAFKHADVSLNPRDPIHTVEGWPVAALGYFMGQKSDTGRVLPVNPAEFAAEKEWAGQLGSAPVSLNSAEAASYRQQLEQTRAQLEAIYATLDTSLSWRFANRVGRMANRLCPPGSWRGRVYAAVLDRLRGERRRARAEPRG